MSLIVCTMPQCQTSAGCICQAQMRPLLARLRAKAHTRDEVLEEAAKVAEQAHMVPPDGGSPTDAEYEVAQEAARRIRALKEGK